MDGQNLAKQTFDQIPQANTNAKRIVGLIKEGGRITGYQFALGFATGMNEARRNPGGLLYISFLITALPGNVNAWA